MRPYLRLATHDEAIRRIVQGLLKRQAFLIRHDPYAAALDAHPRARARTRTHTDTRAHGSASAHGLRGRGYVFRCCGAGRYANSFRQHHVQDPSQYDQSLGRFGWYGTTSTP